MINYNKKIPSIGQGGFIVQTINSEGKAIQIIYDCGTKSPKTKIISEIKKLNTQIDTILVISHFHADHINKVHELKANKVNVVKVIIPKIHKNEMILLASKCDEDLILKFVYDPKLLFEDASIVYVENDNENSQPIENERDESFQPSNLEGTINHNNSYSIIKGTSEWLIKFYVDKHIFSSLVGADLKTVDAITTIDELLKQKTILREIYDRISKNDPNKTNMMMFVYPKYNRFYNIVMHHSKQHCLNRYFSSLIMCTGDVKIDSTSKSLEIKNHFLDLIYLITDIMLPHHGSNDYFDFNPFDYLLRSYAQTEKSKHGHPGNETIKKLELKSIEFYNIS